MEVKIMANEMTKAENNLQTSVLDLLLGGTIPKVEKDLPTAS